MDGTERTDQTTTALTRPPEVASPDDVATAALATVRDVTNELVRLVRETATQATDGWSIASVVRPLVPEIDQVFAERDTLETEVLELRNDLADADEKIRELEARLAARETGWNAERLVLETEASREREQAHMLSEDLERHQKEAELLAARQRRLREQMEAATARANADREETLRLAREMVQSAEDARLAIVDEMEQLRAALAAEQAHVVEIQHERTRVTQGAAEREAELARTRHTLEQLETSRTTAASELARARAKLVQTESELLASQHEYQLAQAHIDRLCSAHDELVEDRAQLVAKLHDAKERDSRLRLRITRLEQRIQAVATEGVTATVAPEPAPAVEAAVESATTAMALELSRTEERARSLETELAKAKAGASAAGSRVETLQSEMRAAEQARLAAAAEVKALRAAVEALEDAARTARESAPLAPPTPEAPTAIACDVAPVEPTAEVEPPIETIAQELLLATPEDVPQETAPETPEEALQGSPCESPEELTTIAVADDDPRACVAEPEIAAEPEPMQTEEYEHDTIVVDDAPTSVDSVAVSVTMVVLDGAAAWPAPEGVTTHHVPLDAETGDRVRELDPACCLVNLAAPGALATLASLRVAKITTPFWGCAIGDGADSGVVLGAFDVIPRPVDADAVHTQLEGRVPAAANVITVGSDSSTLIPLRQGLLQGGMTVRTAWNRQQAADLSTVVFPDVLILDLASDPSGLAAFVVELGRRERPPLIVLVPGAPQHVDAFGAALAQCATATTADRDGLLQSAAISAPMRAS